MRHITLGKVLARDWIIQTSSEKTLNYGSMVFLTYQQKITDAYFGGDVDLSDVVRPHRWSTPPTPPGKAAGLQMAALPFILISTTFGNGGRERWSTRRSSGELTEEETGAFLSYKSHKTNAKLRGSADISELSEVTYGAAGTPTIYLEEANTNGIRRGENGGVHRRHHSGEQRPSDLEKQGEAVQQVRPANSQNGDVREVPAGDSARSGSGTSSLQSVRGEEVTPPFATEEQIAQKDEPGNQENPKGPAAAPSPGANAPGAEAAAKVKRFLAGYDNGTVEGKKVSSAL